MNSRVNVEVVLTKKEFFCDIIVTVLEAVTKVPIPNAKVELWTSLLGGELIMTAPTNSDGLVILGDMPVGKTYGWKITHIDYNTGTGTVTTI